MMKRYAIRKKGTQLYFPSTRKKEPMKGAIELSGEDDDKGPRLFMQRFSAQQFLVKWVEWKNPNGEPTGRSYQQMEIVCFNLVEVKEFKE